MIQNIPDAEFLVKAIGLFPNGTPDASTLAELQAEAEEKLANASKHGAAAPVDQRIQAFLDRYMEAQGVKAPRLTNESIELDRWGLARTLSLPKDGNMYESDTLKSYRLRQGVLHNPFNDRRTTQGVFHVVEGGLAIPDDKKSVPVSVFAKLLERAFVYPENMAKLPYNGAKAICSLLLRPVICPEVPGWTHEKSMEVRFFAPGSLLSNLDFVESIFGNAGNPHCPKSDSALDVDHWSGHTGCIILAPHLTRVTKKDLGLPFFNDATPRQKRDGMCWKTPDEFYNDGSAFKITVRDNSGVIVTIIADNYYGYCKKEVKTQISYATNLFGNTEEEHAGGALAFPAYDLGEDFQLSTYNPGVDHTFAQLLTNMAGHVELLPEGHARDKKWTDIFYIPENSRIQLRNQKISWTDAKGQEQQIRLAPGITYILPSGYKIELVKDTGTNRWRLVGTTAHGTLCHKPSTVSGGGKSEISKSIAGSILRGAVVIKDYPKDVEMVDQLIQRNYADRYPGNNPLYVDSRAILSKKRSLGSVIKLLTKSEEYTPEYNAWLNTIPDNVKEFLLQVKRHYRESWGNDWRKYFSVDLINGHHGYALKYKGERIFLNYLRIGFSESGEWRTFSLRDDFRPSRKIQMEDDITASVVVPKGAVASLANEAELAPSVKFTHNCEYRLFQRPDDAVHPGYDAQTEADLAQNGNFISNFEPLTLEQFKTIAEDAIKLDHYSPAMGEFISDFAANGKPGDYACCSSMPRIVNGKPSKNPRYLQTRTDLLKPREIYIAEVGTRLMRRQKAGSPAAYPVHAVLAGRRNNVAEPGVRPLCCFGPIHYLELPELFLELVSSMTGKSPSTTGAGSEGALTKGPFNALLPVLDLNATLVSLALTRADVFISAAGCVGPKFRVDHDISMLVPEVWSRMTPEERTAGHLIKMGCLERCEDIEYKGKTLQASRLGWRINEKFASRYLGRVFTSPDLVLPAAMLRPELQDLDVYCESLENVLVTHRRVAENYFADGSIELACPPIKALLHIMAYGNYNGHDINSHQVRDMFRPEAMLGSDWYVARLKARQEVELNLNKRFIAEVEAVLKDPARLNSETAKALAPKIEALRHHQKEIAEPNYWRRLVGTIGCTPQA